MDCKGSTTVQGDLEAAPGLQHGSAQIVMDAESNKKRKYELVPVPLDGGYGWVIVASAASLSLLLLCAFTTTGIFMVEFIEYFNVSKVYASWISSLMMAVIAVVGPMLPVIIKRFGCRFVAMIGSFGYSVSFILTSLAPNMPFLIFSLGLLTGIFACSIYMSGQVMVHYYFDKKRGLASGMAVAGTALAMFAWPPVVRYLIDTYSWRGASLIISGICLNGIVFGSLLRPPPRKKVYKTITSEHTDNEKDSKEIINNSNKCCLAIGKKATHIIMFFAWFLILAGHTLVTVFIPLRGEILGISKKQSAFLLSAIGIVSGCVRLFAGWVGDRPCVKRNILAGVFASYGGLLTVISLSFKTFPTLLMFAILYGIGGGFTSGLQSACLYDVVGIKNISYGFSILFVAMGLSSLIAIPIGGYLYDVTGRPLETVVIFGLVHTLGGIFLASIPFLQSYLRKRNKHQTSQSTKT